MTFGSQTKISRRSACQHAAALLCFNAGTPMTTHADQAELAEFTSPHSYAQTVDKLAAAIERGGLSVMARVDHAAAAAAVGLSMPPTIVMLYGNPRGGTPIMLAHPAAALDLPLRVLIREDEDGKTRVAFHPIVALLARADVASTIASKLEPAQRLLVDAISA
jgi:uncharacterized protein (DUF302 family)